MFISLSTFQRTWLSPSSALKMKEAAISSETLDMFHQTTCHHILEDGIFIIIIVRISNLSFSFLLADTVF
jgi:hypothetical protein